MNAKEEVVSPKKDQPEDADDEPDQSGDGNTGDGNGEPEKGKKGNGKKRILSRRDPFLNFFY